MAALSLGRMVLPEGDWRDEAELVESYVARGWDRAEAEMIGSGVADGWPVDEAQAVAGVWYHPPQPGDPFYPLI